MLLAPLFHESDERGQARRPLPPPRVIQERTGELGQPIVYGVLSRSLISGHWSKARAGERDFRAIGPRFQGANLDRNLALVEQLRAVADRIGASVAQVAIAWVAAQGTDIVPLVGARRRERLTEALGALDVRLSSEDVAALTRAVPTEAVAGDR